MKENLDKILNIKRKIEVTNQTDKKMKLIIYGYIGGWENDAESVIKEIEDADVEEIHVHINSGGGSAFDGIAIHNILKRHKAKVVVNVDGWAASAASIIAMAGDEVIMPSNTMMMIHQASTFGYGNADDFEKAVKMLRKVDKSVRASYASRFTGTEEELSDLLKEESWLNADEAVSLGLADKVVDEVEVEEIEEEVDNIKDKLVAKYKKENKKEEQPADEKPSNIARLFF